ncbi:sialate O-acetylesterase [Planctomycetes bacterium TBK1r]|uniref:Sialate O-acetylesterase domain-containing protein n=1 Tax=Stieleria magnilauensis TaxID=2527963 RepID=A0ABX5XTY3_9BACT|nr:hypothetical protein TBK1r_41510 [Planctomycetes bacterium TBK1r]
MVANYKFKRICLAALVAAVLFSSLSSPACGESKPLRVYLLVGQSNMVGTGAISTIDFIGEDLALKERASGTGGFVYYYGSAKSHARAGQAFAEALLKLESP